MKEDRMAIEEDQNEDFWSLLVDLVYTTKLALKRSWNYVRVTNPSKAILGMSHVRMHVI
jgi:hypothetical protein